MFDRDEQEISQIIENGLEAILSGSATLESVVAQHPEQAEVIRPELEGALWLVSQRQEVEARPGFVTASRKRVVDRIKAEARSQGAKHSLFGFAWPRQHAFQWVLTVIMAMILLTSAGSLLTISQNSLPGDGLYAVKRISETVSYTVTLDEVQRVQLSAQFAERRLEEARVLIGKGEFSTAEVSLRDYEQGVTQTLVLLEKVQTTQVQPVEVEQLAATVKEGLVTNTERLAEIAETVPPSGNGQVTIRVQKALSTSRNGALAAGRVYEEMKDKKAAATAVPAVPTKTSPAIRPAATSTPRAPTTPPTEPARPKDTPVPNTPVPNTPVPNTPVPTSVPVDTATAIPQPTATPEPTDTATPKPTATRKPTATPTAVPTATDIPLPTDTPTAQPTPTDAPLPTDVPTDTPTDIPTDIPFVSPDPTSQPVDITPPTAVPSEIAPIGVVQPTATDPVAPSATPHDNGKGKTK